MKLGPDFHRPETGIRVPAVFRNAPADRLLVPAEDRWWREFGDSQLDRVVAEALRNNLDIRKAAAAVLEMRARFVQTRADRFPSVNMEGQAKRTHQPIIGIIPGKSFSVESDSFSLSMPASFELDLWGRLARAEEGARAELLEAEENRRTVAQGIVARAVTLYFRIAALERRIRIARERIENGRRHLDVVAARYRKGLASVLDVSQARRNLSRARAALPALRQDLGTARQDLSVLLGYYPETGIPLHTSDKIIPRLPPVPAGLPSDLLMRRPDILAAEARLKALNAYIGVARASRFPRITLTGAFGYSSDALRRLLTSRSRLWNLATGTTQPVFNAGKLKAVERAAAARYRQGVADYAKTVLNAFAEVERALLTGEAQQERCARERDYLAAARATESVLGARYARGLTDYAAVLDAREARLQAEENVIQAELAVLVSRVDLHRALGGNWTVGCR